MYSAFYNFRPGNTVYVADRVGLTVLQGVISVVELQISQQPLVPTPTITITPSVNASPTPTVTPTVSVTPSVTISPTLTSSLTQTPFTLPLSTTIAYTILLIDGTTLIANSGDVFATYTQASNALIAGDYSSDNNTYSVSYNFNPTDTCWFITNDLKIDDGIVVYTKLILYLDVVWKGNN